MAERFKAPVLKTEVLCLQTRVQVPSCPFSDVFMVEFTWGCNLIGKMIDLHSVIKGSSPFISICTSFILST